MPDDIAAADLTDTQPQFCVGDLATAIQLIAMEALGRHRPIHGIWANDLARRSGRSWWSTDWLFFVFCVARDGRAVEPELQVVQLTSLPTSWAWRRLVVVKQLHGQFRLSDHWLCQVLWPIYNWSRPVMSP